MFALGRSNRRSSSAVHSSLTEIAGNIDKDARRHDAKQPQAYSAPTNHESIRVRMDLKGAVDEDFT
ncbi:hypothetical protein JMJ77_0008183 [Colletotrichum scovillei]|uniref:Uncharacterized protein n=1 Tax=Colletotrichum scovillei TaxID=1209932 RepID=A0A9P7RE99_9PEZI|nr:hypothetical protein JMJ77_0008183 [Colletotrichum scovillei]KAG7075174.1 hypothetical protein JMJ76_0011636 [Colletotrichum scovillei]KAG7082269.1 hypothetical protein JMJ78_0004372 [Colletotrichum scovillei]